MALDTAADETLRPSEEQYRRIFEASLGALVVFDTDGTVAEANPAATAMYGYSRRRMIGLAGKDIVHPDCYHLFEELKSRVEAGGEFQVESVHVRKDGTPFDIEIQGRPLLYKGRQCLLATVRDISNRKRAEKKLLDYQHQLRSLASELSLTEERERREIATVLHDRVAQTLALSKTKLAAIAQSARATRLSDSLGEVLALIDQAIENTRSLAKEISPPILYELGLEEALRWLAQQLAQHYGIKTEFEDDGRPKPISDDIRVVLFQAVRELLVNVARHARAQTARVSVARHRDMITVTVEDDGIGFEPDESGPRRDKQGGLGLFNIRERLRYLGGRLEIESRPGRGSTFTLVGPLASEGKEEYAP